MYSIRKQFYTAVGLFSFFLLCGFISPLLGDHTAIRTTKTGVEYSLHTENPSNNLENGTLDLTITTGKAPYKVLLYSTTMPVKEYQIEKTLSIKHLSAGEYMIVVSGSDNEFKSKTITLTNN